MPITKSAKKSLRVSINKRADNKKQEDDLKKTLKKVSASNVNEVISKIDKAAKTHIISKNKAARLKSRLSKKYGTPKAAPKVKSESVKVKSSTKKAKIK